MKILQKQKLRHKQQRLNKTGYNYKESITQILEIITLLNTITD